MSSAGAVDDAGLLAVTADRAWDPQLGAGNHRLLVLVSVESGRIIDVDRSGAFLPPGATVLDAGPGTTLLPGLIDCHAHLTFDPDDADLLIVDGDPVGDLRALLRPGAVVRAGRVVWP